MTRELADRLTEAAREAARLRARSDDDGRSTAALTAVKDWQARRLAATHGDLLGDPRYRPAALFFLDDLYQPKDVRWRDAELARIIPTLGRYLPPAALTTLVQAIELDLLSERLDARVARHVASPGPLDETTYAGAYRAAGTPDERHQQLALMLTVGRSLDRLVRKPLLSGLLTAMGPVAHAAGLQAIHGFLQRGFSAFRSMGGAERFLDLIAARETALMERLFAGASAGLMAQGGGHP